MSEEKKPFTVTDKRHFTREGEVREDAPAMTAAEPKAPEPPAASPTAAGPPPAPPAAPPVDPEHARAEASYRQAAARASRTDEQGGLDFVGLLLSLGTQASMLLGGGAPPGGKAGPPDLAGARSIITLLEILEDKTAGRRTAEEDEVLDGLLYELRMQYVALSRKGGP